MAAAGSPPPGSSPDHPPSLTVPGHRGSHTPGRARTRGGPLATPRRGALLVLLLASNQVKLPVERVMRGRAAAFSLPGSPTRTSVARLHHVVVVITDGSVSDPGAAPARCAPGGSRPQPSRWPSIAAAAVAAGTAVAYGWAIGELPLEPYYAATMQSMVSSWHNFAFGAFDPAGTFSVCRPRARGAGPSPRLLLGADHGSSRRSRGWSRPG
jgi:hypothetical protein